MDGAKARARTLGADLASALVSGDDHAVAKLCADDVRWWTPVSGENAAGPAGAVAALREVLAPLRQPLTVSAVIPGDDGTRCVVELRSAGDQDGLPPVFVTSVLTVHDDTVTAARTYTDLRDHGGQPAVVVP
jgi:ketosteroid isomerase-like protein